MERLEKTHETTYTGCTDVRFNAPTPPLADGSKALYWMVRIPT